MVGAKFFYPPASTSRWQCRNSFLAILRISKSAARPLLSLPSLLCLPFEPAVIITSTRMKITRSFALFCLCAPALGPWAAAETYPFTTLAGAAGAGGSTDATGSAARFNHPEGVAVDGSGNVYVADTGNHMIRKISAAGVVSTAAGSPGSTGSTDGTRSAARFNTPDGVAADGSGNVYVADTRNHTIRKISAAGVVTTLAGTAGSTGSTDGTGSAARFKHPRGVAVDDSGNVYVADRDNSTIRKISAAGVVTTLAGTAGSGGSTDGTGSAARFNQPRGVAVDSTGNIYVADTSNQTIRKISAAGVVTTLAGTAGTSGSADGTGSAARFKNPRGVAVDASGNVYVADSNNETIRKISAAGAVTTLAGTAGRTGSTDGTGSAARFSNPYGVAVDGSGNVYVADTSNSTIRKIPAGALTQRVAPKGEAGHQRPRNHAQQLTCSLINSRNSSGRRVRRV